jgi:hypothetical protein
MVPIGEHMIGEQRAIVFGVERPAADSQPRLKPVQPG